MKNFSCCRMLLLALLLGHFGSGAQLRPLSLRVAFQNETTGLPVAYLLKLPVHPSFNVGADFRVKRGKHWQKALGADVSYYYHRLAEHAIMLDASYRIGYRFSEGPELSFLSSIGYKHTLISGKVYRQVDGAYEESTHWGKPMVNVKLGLGLSYPLSENYSLMTDYKVMLAGPSGGIYVPFSVNTFLGAGLIIHLKNKNRL